jgi:hypothetical protein
MARNSGSWVLRVFASTVWISSQKRERPAITGWCAALTLWTAGDKGCHRATCCEERSGKRLPSQSLRVWWRATGKNLRFAQMLAIG